jgi:hypothetical protein
MKLKIIHYVLIAIIIMLSILFVKNNIEKYTDVSQTVVLNPKDGSFPTLSVERTQVTCDTSDSEYPICLDSFKITHPRTSYDIINDTTTVVTDEQKAAYATEYNNFVSATPVNVFFLNPPSDVDQTTGIKKGIQIKYDCDPTGEDCKFDLRF